MRIIAALACTLATAAIAQWPQQPVKIIEGAGEAMTGVLSSQVDLLIAASPTAMGRETVRWGEIARDAGVKPE